MKVIFLDINGVLVLDHEQPEPIYPRSQNPRKVIFSEEAIQTLNEVLTLSGAEIVVSSDWRLHHSLEEINILLKEAGLCKAAINVTPNLEKDKPSLYKKLVSPQWNLEDIRCKEIDIYLKANPSIKKWCAIDDLFLGYDFWENDIIVHTNYYGMDNFVWIEDDEKGLLPKHKGYILSYLL